MCDFYPPVLGLTLAGPGSSRPVGNQTIVSELRTVTRAAGDLEGRRNLVVDRLSTRSPGSKGVLTHFLRNDPSGVYVVRGSCRPGGTGPSP